ncbi:MAG: hypothetical protein ACJ749_11245 [Flavisolibacter sp.]
MSKNNFTIQYNGRRADCMRDGNDFMVQITYKPVYLELQTGSDGIHHWIEKDTRQETDLSKELGRLIKMQYLE